MTSYSGSVEIYLVAGTVGIVVAAANQHRLVSDKSSRLHGINVSSLDARKVQDKLSAERRAG